MVKGKGTRSTDRDERENYRYYRMGAEHERVKFTLKSFAGFKGWLAYVKKYSEN